MPICSRCQQPVDSQAVSCPHCNNLLKAFGHPGMPLYQSEGSGYLCDRCTYDRDDSCNFPKRPYAKSCTLFHDASTPLVPEAGVSTRQMGWGRIRSWLERNRGLVAIALLIVLSILLALNSS